MRILFVVAVLFGGGALIALDALVKGYRIGGDQTITRPLSEAVDAELRRVISPLQINSQIAEAARSGDHETSALYTRIAKRAGAKVKPQAVAETSAPNSGADPSASNGDARESAISARAFSSAVAADLAAFGAGRDLMAEGAKLARGEAHDLGIAALSALSAAARGDRFGDEASAQLGISVLKTAYRSGLLNPVFSGALLDATGDVVDRTGLEDALSRGAFATAGEAERAAADYVRASVDAPVVAFADRTGQIAGAVGPGEGVRLLQFVETREDLETITLLAQEIGADTRGVIEFTGHNAPQAFERSISYREFVSARIHMIAIWLLAIAAAGAMATGRLNPVRIIRTETA